MSEKVSFQDVRTFSSRKSHRILLHLLFTFSCSYSLERYKNYSCLGPLKKLELLKEVPGKISSCSNWEGVNGIEMKGSFITLLGRRFENDLNKSH